LQRFKCYINGEFTNARSGEFSTVYNPATEEAIYEVPKCSEEDANLAIEAAAAAQKRWSKLTPMDRAAYVKRLGENLLARVEEIAPVLSCEEGKTLNQAKGEIRGACSLLEYHLGWARRIEGEILPGDSANENLIIMREPVGVVACIIPWNYPIYVLLRKLVPALIAGCTLICKPSSETPAATMLLAQAAHDAGFPKGVVNFITGSGRVIGNALAKSSKVNMITVTGSVETGREIMRIASNNVMKLSLELGGKAPAIVMADADLEMAADCVTEARLANAGQVCACAERLYVHESIADQFVEMMKERMEKATFGDGMKNPGHTMGALINKESVIRVHGMVERAVTAGGKIICGGKIPEGKGAFYPPTLITNVAQDSEIVKEEVFGPVLPVLTFKTAEEALALANDCKYGLTSTLFTNNYNTVMLFMNNVEFGELYVNRAQSEAFQGYHTGWKLSGVGGDDGKHGFSEFFKMRVVYLDYKDTINV
jgi:lactaldehyde dehydrogenase/glycolaldehyde dehydrogenase